MGLSGKVVAVTGAESGIGRAIALECARQRASVALIGLVEEGLAETQDAIVEFGGSAVTAKADIRRDDEVREAFERTLAVFGHLDAVVANAGIATPPCPAIDVPAEDWRRVVDVNLTGTFLTVTHAARILVGRGRGGSIVATGSSTALKAMPGLSAYSAAKAGVHALMQALALELGPHRIRVNTLVPGTTATPLTRTIPGHLERVARDLPLGEVVEPEELARYVAFVLGDALPHITGSLLKVDSGRTV